MSSGNGCADGCGCSGSAAIKSKDLTGIFNPRHVAIIGATPHPDKIGYQILKNTIDGGFAGEILPIHPREAEILGKKAYKSVLEVPGPIDLAIIAIPAKLVIPTLLECAQKGIKNVSVITSGFSEVGNVKDEQEIKAIGDKKGLS